MDSFVEKFNIFDLFTMLIPGIIISTLFGISLSFKYYNLWENLGNEKYAIFFIFSYMCGVIFQEIGTIADKKFLHNILYGGNPREIFLLKNGHGKILNEELFYKDALHIKKYIINTLDINIKKDMNIEDEKDLNSLIFGYCLNILENKKLANKSEKMHVISEMSRSLFWGCISVIILNLVMILKHSTYCSFYCIEIFFLIIMCLVFLCRKKRYEKYRYRILLRTFSLYIKEDTD